MSKILIHCLSFSPVGVSTAYLYNDIALKFKERGYDVVVFTTTPHSNASEADLLKQKLHSKCFGLFYISNYEGIKVFHVPLTKYKSSILRMFGFVYWHLITIILSIFERNIDIILSPSPPITLGVLNIFIAKMKGAKVIYNVQEIYPDLLIEGWGLKSKVIIWVLKGIEKFVYRHSDMVTTIDSIFYNTIVGRFRDSNRLKIIPNFVDTKLYKPIPTDQIKVDRQLFPNNDSLKLMYAGNIGYAQEWKSLIKIAKKLKNDNIEFFIIGEGTMSNYLKNEVKKNELKKVHIIQYQIRESMPDIMAYSDIQFIFMSKETEAHGFPSKVYSIMACAKPMLVCSGENTPIINFLKDINCAILVKTLDFDSKIDEVVDILRNIDRNELVKLGMNGQNTVELHYSKEIITNMYVDLSNSLLQ